MNLHPHLCKSQKAKQRKSKISLDVAAGNLIKLIVTKNKNSTIMKRTEKNTQENNVSAKNRKILLESISDDWKKIRTENSFDAELSMLIMYSRKRQNKYYTKTFEEDLENILKSKKENNTESNIIFAQMQKNRLTGNSAKPN